MQDQHDLLGAAPGARDLLLSLTGARLNDILSLCWEAVDFEGEYLWLGDSKTGEEAAYFGAPAMSVLASVPRIDANLRVICEDRHGALTANLQKPWRRIRTKSKL